MYLGTCYSNEIMKAYHPQAGSKGNGWVLVTFLLSKNVLYIFILIFGTSIYRSNIIVASLGFVRSSADQKTLASEDDATYTANQGPLFFCHSFRIKKKPKSMLYVTAKCHKLTNV